MVDAARFVTGRRQFMSLRLLAMAWWFLLGEMRAYAVAAGIWVFSRYGSERRRCWAYALRIRWMAGHVAGLRAIMGLTFEVEGVEEAGPGPVVIFMRHASIIDNTLPDALAARAHGMGLRYVIKRELEALGAIDIVARWIPTYLAARDSKDTEADVAAVRKLTENFGPGTREGILIYPEGTRFTAKRLARAKEVIAERQPENAERAARLQHILPPKLGGPIAVLEETAPVRRGVLRPRRLRRPAHGGRHLARQAGGQHRSTCASSASPAATCPTGREDKVAWLYERWQEVDDWVGEHL